MKIGTVEKFRLPVLKPLGTGQGLAFGTVAVRTRVVPHAFGGRTGHTLRRDRRERPCGTTESPSSHAAVRPIARRRTFRDRLRRSGGKYPPAPASNRPPGLELALLGRAECFGINGTRQQVQWAGGGTYLRDGDS